MCYNEISCAAHHQQSATIGDNVGDCSKSLTDEAHLSRWTDILFSLSPTQLADIFPVIPSRPAIHGTIYPQRELINRNLDLWMTDVDPAVGLWLLIPWSMDICWPSQGWVGQQITGEEGGVNENIEIKAIFQCWFLQFSSVAHTQQQQHYSIAVVCKNWREGYY